MTLIEPRMLTSASNVGFATDTMTLACAARWKTTSGFRWMIRSVTAPERTSRRWNVMRWLRWPRASARFASDPIDRSSTTSTSWPSASSRSTRVEPMKPAPPVTRTRTDQPAAADSSTRSSDTAAPAAIRAPAATTEQSVSVARAPTSAPGPTIERSTMAPSPTRAPASSTAPLDHGVGADDAGTRQRRALHARAALDHGLVTEEARGRDARIAGELEVALAPTLLARSRPRPAMAGARSGPAACRCAPRGTSRGVPMSSQ